MNLGWTGFMIIETVQQAESEPECPGTDFSCDRLVLKRQKMDWIDLDRVLRLKEEWNATESKSL